MKDAFSDQPPTSSKPSSDPEPGSGKLGSLAQAARGKKLKEARGILLFVGVLTIVINIVFLFIARDNVKNEIEKEITKMGGRGNVQIDQAKLKQLEDHAVMIVTLVNGVAIALGVVFVVLGLIVNRFPVPVTILSLILYVGANIGFAALDYSTVATGLIMKIIVIVALVKALQAALAYEKEKKRSAAIDPAI